MFGRFGIAFAAMVAMLGASSATSAVLFSDSFAGPLDMSKYASNFSGVVAAAPDGSGNALHFTQTRAVYDLLTNIITGTGAGTFTLEFDYFCATAAKCGGFVGVYPGGSTSTNPGSSDGWLATDRPQDFGTPFTISVPTTTAFTHQVFTFNVTSGGAFALKLEDFSGAPGDAYFRNLTLSSGGPVAAAVPEPASWAMMIGGFGLIGASMRRARTRQSVRFG